MDTKPPATKKSTPTESIHILVTESDLKKLKRKSVDDSVKLSVIGRNFFLAWLNDDENALALVTPSQQE